MYFRKKPVEVAAMHFVANMEEIVTWMNQGRSTMAAWHDGTQIFIETLGGTMRADVGDWIIRGVAGEFYPCKPDIFAATYEEVPHD